ncbi:MAG: hypothetical protein LBI33_12765 [Propionibacteriaceae bacterium]|jgi:hypothetical protein|nr:hypothetical protein [Propionibacteriaceae bacterium]
MTPVTNEDEGLTAAATCGLDHTGRARVLRVPVMDMSGARRFGLVTSWLTGGADGVQVELVSGSEMGNPWLSLWVRLPDGTRVEEGINVVDLVQAWVDAITGDATDDGEGE